MINFNCLFIFNKKNAFFLLFLFCFSCGNNKINEFSVKDDSKKLRFFFSGKNEDLSLLSEENSYTGLPISLGMVITDRKGIQHLGEVRSSKPSVFALPKGESTLHVLYLATPFASSSCPTPQGFLYSEKTFRVTFENDIENYNIVMPRPKAALSLTLNILITLDSKPMSGVVVSVMNPLSRSPLYDPCQSQYLGSVTDKNGQAIVRVPYATNISASAPLLAFGKKGVLLLSKNDQNQFLDLDFEKNPPNTQSMSVSVTFDYNERSLTYR